MTILSTNSHSNLAAAALEARDFVRKLEPSDAINNIVNTFFSHGAGDALEIWVISI